jgi:virginiamycin B lyase
MHLRNAPEGRLSRLIGSALAAVTLLAATAACSSSAGPAEKTASGSPASTSTSAPASDSASSTASTPISSSPSPLPTSPMTDLARRYRTAEVTVGGSPDWQVVAFGSLWVANDQRAQIQRISTATNRVVSVVDVDSPCAGMVAAAGTVWAPDCGRQQIVRISPRTGQVVARIAADLSDPEGYIAAGAGRVWFVSSAGELDGIDATSNRVTAKVKVPAGAAAVAFGFGELWVSDPADDAVIKIDPTRMAVAARIRVGSMPRFLAAGEGAVWALDQGDGNVSRIDPRSSTVRAIAADSGGKGGCIATGFGAVWVTIPGAPVTRIEATTGKVTAQFRGDGGDCLSTGDGSLWLSNNQSGTVWRIRPFA